jgi:hypothetical protein
MINNIDIVKPLLNFENENDFYYLQILQRKKENPQLGNNSRVIKNYYINSINDLENKYTEIKQLCDIFNARASIRLNKRCYEKVAFKTLLNISNNMMNKDYYNIKKCYDRTIGKNHNDNNKTWIIDVDEELTLELFNIIEGFTIGTDPNKGVSKIITIIPSKNGTHIISKPFNLIGFKNQFPDIEIHKDNPTNLYIP